MTVKHPNRNTKGMTYLSTGSIHHALDIHVWLSPSSHMKLTISIYRNGELCKRKLKYFNQNKWQGIEKQYPNLYWKGVRTFVNLLAGRCLKNTYILIRAFRTNPYDHSLLLAFLVIKMPFVISFAADLGKLNGRHSLQFMLQI